MALAMTRLARRASLLLAFYMLISTATAYAERAWVLWEESFSVGSGGLSVKEWEIVVTADTVATCMRVAGDAARDRAGRFEKGGVARAKIEGNQVTIESPAAIFNYRYLCLPDTVDPSGPKGR